MSCGLESKEVTHLWAGGKPSLVISRLVTMGNSGGLSEGGGGCGLEEGKMECTMCL